MAPTDSTTQDASLADDLSPLAWVHGELRRSLETAHKALRRHLKEAEAVAGSDVDVVDPSVLRTARSQLHQGVGALELVGLPALADVLRASEAAVQRLIARPAMADTQAVETIERSSFALLDFLGRQLAGKPVSPVMLFPQYRAAQQLAGADRVHPADLWKLDWQWRELPPDASAHPRPADDEARGLMETLVLALMREPGAGPLARMSDLCADLGAGARQQPESAHLATFWQLAAAVFEGQASGLLAADVYTKRIASRLLAQLRASARGQPVLSDRLAQDLLFFCSHATAPDTQRPAPRLAEVRRTWRLDQRPTADYETPRLGRLDPALIALARKRVAAAKDAWSAVAGGELHRLSGISEQFSLVGESLARLFPEGEQLATVLQNTVAQTVAAQQAPAPALAMEVATAILYLDASLEDGELDHPQLSERVQRLARRIDEVRIGAEPHPLESWMEELYRRVSDRQTMGSVVQELRSTLSEVEKQIDAYFRDPAERSVLIPVPGQLSAMRGVLSVLGLDQASAAALHMRDAVDELVQTEADPQQAVQSGSFDRLADNLGALSFLIDMLSVQPALAKSLFRFDPATGALAAVMGQAERSSAFAELDPVPAEATLTEQVRALADDAVGAAVPDDELAAGIDRAAQRAVVAEQRELARALGAAKSALAAPGGRAAAGAQLAAAADALAPPVPEPAPAPAPLPPARPPAAAGDTGLEDDAEMREIFLEEAREVVADAGAALERLAEAPESPSDMTAVRRAFHTLKGSSRMVGLRDFGEAAWACEQLYNARLAAAPRMDQTLRQFTGEALAYLSAWTDAIAAGRDDGHRSQAVTQAADALRLQGRRIGIEPALAPLAQPAVEQAAQPAAETVAEPIAEPATVPPALEETATEPEPQADEPATALPPAELEALPVPEVASLESVETLSLDLDAADLPPTEPLPLAELGFDLDLPGQDPAPVVLDFEFKLDADEPAATEPAPPAAAQPLAARVPDLPSAADLDLGAPAAPEFELDFGPTDEPAPAEAALELPLDAPVPAADETAEPDDLAEPLVPAVEAIELDPDTLDEVFATRTRPPGEALARPAPEVLPELQQALEGVDLSLPGTPLPARPEVAAQSAAFEPPDEVPEVPDAVEPAAPAEPAQAALPAGLAEDDDEQVKLIGDLRISIPLFNIFLNEADELSRRLGTELAEWALEHERHPVPESAVALAHSLAGNSATVGYADLSALARALEHALQRSHEAGVGDAFEAELFNEVADEIRRLLHQFAAGFLRPVDAELMQRLLSHERQVFEQPEAVERTAPLPELPAAPELTAVRVTGFTPLSEPGEGAAAPADAFDDDEDIDAVDAIDADLFPIFEEEAEELLPQLQARLREWMHRPHDRSAASGCMRTLHTFKGGARLAGAMRLGEMAHRLETAVEHLVARDEVPAADVEQLLHRADAISNAFDVLRHRGTAPTVAPPASVEQLAEPLPELAPEPEPTSESAPDVAAEPASEPDLTEQPLAEPHAPALVVQAPPVAIDWGRFNTEAEAQPLAEAGERSAAATGGAAVRVRAGLLDRMVNQAGEVSITRARIDADVRQLQTALGDLTDSLERMRRQLRDIELQAETQISSRMEAAKAEGQNFDPLEMDRFTRFQELTRFMAESVNDVATLQRGLQRTVQSAEDSLAAQARLTRELQDDLLRTRMVEFESLADRLYRTVRQAAKDTGKAVRLDIAGGAIEVDRGVLERMAGPFEHLLRNSVAHGIEAAERRAAAGKDGTGRIQITVSQSGNEVAVEFADDGGGLDLARIHQRGVERGLVAADQALADEALAQLIFAPGFSTAEAITELAGRGVGLDVVKAEVNAMGGRIETASAPGQGTRFKLLLPLTTAVTQVVMLRAGELRIAVPSTLVEVVRRVPTAEVLAAYDSGALVHQGETLPFFWLPALLQAGSRGETEGRTQAVVVIRSAAQRVAVHLDEVLGNQEVVVKNVGPQLARLPGLAGLTLLPSGSVALIYNPVALAAVYAAEARALMRGTAPALPVPAEAAEPPPQRAPLVLVVDDSLTVRRVTQRLLVREGYRVVLAKDGMEALERLAEERPVVLLSDIEMPRMDGFDLLRNVRADSRLAGLPVVMITSRIAQKHRDYAAELGADHYLGKPYAEEELLSLVARYAGADITT